MVSAKWGVLMANGPCFDMHAWSLIFLAVLGNSSPSANTVKFVMGWGNVESGGAKDNQQCNACDYNMLNMGGIFGHEPPGFVGYCVKLSSTFGILRFDSVHDGAVANANQVKAAYPALTAALSKNDEKALGFTGSMSSDVDSELATWSGGSPGYSQKILQSAGVANTDTTPGGLSGNSNHDLLPPITSSPPSSSVDWMRIAKGGIGVLLLLAGFSLLIKAITPPQVQSAIQSAAKAALA